MVKKATIAPAKNTDRVFHENGDTKDIINTIMWADGQSTTTTDTRDFAPTLRGKNHVESCANVWRWVKRNVKYVLDPYGIQWIKSPSRTYSDGYADCKSRSIFIASCLRNLGIPYAYRFVSYQSLPIYTHVYVIAFPESATPYVLDPDMPGFNVEKKYRYKKDYMSQISYLGDSSSKSAHHGRFKMHRRADKMSTFDISVAARKQRDEIMKKKLESKFGIGCPNAEKLQDRIDVYNDIIEVQSNPKLSEEQKIEHVAGIMEDVESGQYNVSSALAGIGDIGKKSAKRKEKVAERKEKREKKKAQGKTLGQKIKKAGKTVVKAAKKATKGLVKVATAPQRLAAKAILEVTLPKIAPFFIYLFVKDPAIIASLPDMARRKRKTAEKLSSFIIKGIGMKEEHFMGIVRNGIMKRYGKSPEAVLSEALKTNISGIGFLPLIPIITALLPKIIKLFSGSKSDADSIKSGLSDGEPDVASDFSGVTESVRKSIAHKVATQPRDPAEEKADDDGSSPGAVDIPSPSDRNTKVC